MRPSSILRIRVERPSSSTRTGNWAILICLEDRSWAVLICLEDRSCATLIYLEDKSWAALIFHEDRKLSNPHLSCRQELCGLHLSWWQALRGSHLHMLVTGVECSCSNISTRICDHWEELFKNVDLQKDQNFIWVDVKWDSACGVLHLWLFSAPDEMPPHREVPELRHLLLTSLEGIIKNYALHAAQIIASESRRYNVKLVEVKEIVIFS